MILLVMVLPSPPLSDPRFLIIVLQQEAEKQ